MLAAVVLVILGLASSAAVRYLRVDEVRLPDLRGMPYAEAVELLRENELDPVTYPDNVADLPVEVVTSQTPPAGSVVRKGRNVSIGVNRPPEAARAPVLVGLTLDQATRTVRDVNLSLDSVTYAHSSQPPGLVMSQLPEPGDTVGRGEGLAIVVSRGPQISTVTMPDLSGMSVEQARELLFDMGLRSVQAVPAGVSFDAPGSVTSQEPTAGSEVAVSTPVLLGVRLSARRVVPVPGVVGREAQLAERMLRAAGLQVGHVRYVDDPALPSGTVVEVKPDGYTLRGSPVTLTLNAAQGSFDDLAGQDDDLDALFGDEVAEEPNDGRNGEARFTRAGGDEGDEAAELAGLEPTGRRISVTFDPATLGVRSLLERDYDLRLVVQDDNGERTVIDRRVRAGEPVSAVVLVEGDALLQTYINGVFFQAWRP